MVRAVIADDARPKPVEGFSIEQVDDEWFVFHPDRDDVASCNATAGIVWTLCDGARGDRTQHLYGLQRARGRQRE